jgi:uncharacterized protein
MASAHKKCPICRRQAVARFAPFCSARCADEDLGRWLSGSYRIPVVTDQDEDGSEGESPPNDGTPERSS